MAEKNFQKTIYACFVGYMVQALVNNFLPLLFLTFHRTYGIPLAKIALIVSANFILQLILDWLSVFFVDRIGYRICVVTAHGVSALGLVLLAFLPNRMSDPYLGILISMLFCAAGSGLIEVVVSPIMQACPSPNKQTAMSLLHSFYCWGHVAVVLLSTLFFVLFGTENWPILALLWALMPFLNMFVFLKAPIAPLLEKGEKELSLKELLGIGNFRLFLLLMICAGASEISIGQWASTFAEQGLGVSKTLGDLAGPLFFAAMMGTSRAFYGKFGEKISLKHFIFFSSTFCFAAYLITALSPVPLFGLLGCGLCGLFIGIMWPGILSLSSSAIPKGGTPMYSLLALGGDVGCSIGPSLVGFVSAACGGDLHMGILAASFFPLIMALLLFKKLFLSHR